MKRHYFALTLIVFGFSCTQTNKGDNQNSETDKPNETQRVHGDINAFYSANIDLLTDSYYKLWDFAKDKIDTINFSIIESDQISFNNQDVYHLRIAGISSKDWSYSERILIGTSSGEILLESDFIQIEPELKIPECGVGNYSIDSLSTIKIGEHELLTATTTVKFEPCCGQSKEQLTQLLIFTGSKKVEPLELYYWNPSIGSCIEVQPEETRKSSLKTGKSLVINRTIETAGEPTKTVKMEYSYDGKSLKRVNESG